MKAKRYAKYTYPVVKLKKQEVDKVNSCLLNEVTDSVTFRTPARMIRSIRQWRKHIRDIGWGPNVFPPNIMPSFDTRPLPEYLLTTLANLDVGHLMRAPKYLDSLEKELFTELNRTHVGNLMQTGHVKKKNKGCWEVEQSPQSAKLSWRRSGRKRKDEQ